MPPSLVIVHCHPILLFLFQNRIVHLSHLRIDSPTSRTVSCSSNAAGPAVAHAECLAEGPSAGRAVLESSDRFGFAGTFGFSDAAGKDDGVVDEGVLFAANHEDGRKPGEKDGGSEDGGDVVVGSEARRRRERLSVLFEERCTIVEEERLLEVRAIGRAEVEDGHRSHLNRRERNETHQLQLRDHHRKQG
jgi:hypothetical protein